jgi:hypothetical protein
MREREKEREKERERRWQLKGVRDTRWVTMHRSVRGVKNGLKKLQIIRRFVFLLESVVTETENRRFRGKFKLCAARKLSAAFVVVVDHCPTQGSLTQNAQQ